VIAPARRLNPTPKRSDKTRETLKMKNKSKGTTTITVLNIKKLARIAVLTYALKLLFIPDFLKLESRSLNSGKSRDDRPPIS
jgi:hypothetical protein